MKQYSMKKLLSLILCAVLIAAMALMFTGCSDNKTPDGWETKTFKDGDVLGEGSKEFAITVTDADGNQATATIRTEKNTVGEALLDLKLIDGTQEEYGLYIKTANGKTYDYENDGKYWAFYIDGEYAMTGADQTEIQPGVAYELKAE